MTSVADRLLGADTDSDRTPNSTKPPDHQEPVRGGDEHENAHQHINRQAVSDPPPRATLGRGDSLSHRARSSSAGSW